MFLNVLILVLVHDEPEGERHTFINDVADWILARSVDPVSVEESKSKL